MLKLVGIPLQPLEKGVITNLPVMGIFELLVAVNVIELPVVEPTEAIPILLLVLVQEKLVLLTIDPIKGRVISVPEHTILSVMVLMEVVGFTVMLKVLIGPLHPFEKGVTVNTLTMGTLEPPVLVVKARISPVPERPGSPIMLFNCVQL
jgi:hypothetical protein